MTRQQAAAYPQVHERTIFNLLSSGKLPGAKIGRQWRIRKADLDRLLASGTRPKE
jgi:excisionase family DNA binding protein